LRDCEIEARAYHGEIDEAARKKALSEHQKIFDEIVMDQQHLQG